MGEEFFQIEELSKLSYKDPYFFSYFMTNEDLNVCSEYEKEDFYDFKTKLNFNGYFIKSEDDICVYIIKKNNNIIVTSRGTKSLKNVIDDISLYSVKLNKLNRKEFETDDFKIHSIVKKFLKISDIILSFINKLTKLGPVKNLIFTGHSMGALHSIFLTYFFLKNKQRKIKAKIKLFCFATPYLCDKKCSEILEKKFKDNNVTVKNFIDKKDLIPKLKVPFKGLTRIGEYIVFKNDFKFFNFIKPHQKTFFTEKSFLGCKRYIPKMKKNKIIIFKFNKNGYTSEIKELKN